MFKIIHYSGIPTSTGRQVFRSKYLYRKPVQPGLGEPGFQPGDPTRPSSFSFSQTGVAFWVGAVTAVSWTSQSVPTYGGDETNKSFNVLLRDKPLWSSLFLFSGKARGRRGDRRPEFRVRSIRRVVFRRRRWTRGLVLGLKVGLWATPQ